MEQNKAEEAMFSILSTWSSGTIADRHAAGSGSGSGGQRGMYYKVIIPAQEDDSRHRDLAYYCILSVTQSFPLSRLFTM